MAKLPRYSLSHNEKKKAGCSNMKAPGKPSRRFATKAAATKGGVLERAVKRNRLGPHQKAQWQDPRRAHLSAQRRSARL